MSSLTMGRALLTVDAVSAICAIVSPILPGTPTLSQALFPSSHIAVFTPPILRRTALLAFIATSPIAHLSAQSAAAVDTSAKQQRLFNGRDAALAVGFVGATIALFPADKYIAHHLRDQNTQANKFFDHAATGFEVISSPGAFIIGPALYALGRLTNHPRIEDLGWHGAEATYLATAITSTLKVSLGRSRPYVTNDSNPRDFKFFKGLSGDGRTSFPSGHTTTAFAAASAVTAEVNRMWPKYTWVVGPAMYGGATMVGLSRMYHNKHWASDVALGAGIGTFSGLKVVRYSHLHPDNFVDRIILRTSLVPDGHGGNIFAVSIPTAW
jgi:membrane-associated phospholipid phosphatase